jgi:hypothetical protein
MIAKHWTQGGTGITNFHVNKEKLYSAAIEEYGDDNIFVGPPLEPLHTSKNTLALHSYTTDSLSSFWEIFYQVRTSLKEKEYQDCLKDMNHC